MSNDKRKPKEIVLDFSKVYPRINEEQAWDEDTDKVGGKRRFGIKKRK